MKEIVKGHLYALENLKGGGETELRFYRDPNIHGAGWPGPSTQEVIRACIARVKALDAEKPWPGNADIIRHLRLALGGFEARAICRKAEKGEAIELIPAGADGHLLRDNPQP